MGIFLRNGDELVAMQEQSYEAEAVLQELLARYPGLLSGDEGQRRRWILVRRELGVAASVGGADRWSLDHLFLDEDGVPTLVEVKRSADTRIRREVVGQMLDYAANAVAYVDVERLRAEFDARCEAEGLEPDVALVDALALDGDVSEFWERVRTNLAAGKLRLVFVADAIPPELQRIVEFLNEQMTSTEVLALAIKQYSDGGGERQTFVSRTIGQTAAAAQRKRPGRSQTEWSWTDYDAMWSQTQVAIAQALFQAISAAASERGLDWRPVFLMSKIRFNGPAGREVVSILVRRNQPVRIQLNLPRSPRDLGIDNPYPALNDVWLEKWRVWQWEVNAPDDVPEVRPAIEISERYGGPQGSLDRPGP